MAFWWLYFIDGNISEEFMQKQTAPFYLCYLSLRWSIKKKDQVVSFGGKIKAKNKRRGMSGRAF